MRHIFAEAVMRVEQRAMGKSGSINRSEHAVMRGSLLEGSFEESFWKAPQKGEPDRILKAARAYAKVYRKRAAMIRKGDEEGARLDPIPPLTSGALDVLSWLCDMARICKGKLYPSYEAIMEETQRCRQTIAVALKQLERLGILERQNRYRRITPVDDGPSYEQASNVYRLSLPARLIKFLPAYLRPTPVPEDHLQKVIDEGVSVIEMLTSERKTPQIEALPEPIKNIILTVEDDALRESLASFGKQFEECESNKCTETLPISNIYKGDKDMI